MAEYANQRLGFGSADSDGSYASYTYQQQIIQAASVAQLLAEQTNSARRVDPNQSNLLSARPVEGPATSASAAVTAPQPVSRVLGNEPGQGVELHTAATQAQSGPVEAVVRFDARAPIESRAASDALDNDEVAMETTAAAMSDGSPRIQPLLAGMLPVDLPALQAGVERFFAQLEELGDELADPDLAWRIGAWSVTAAGAAAALEFARAEAKNRPLREPRPFGGWRLPPPPLPKENPT